MSEEAKKQRIIQLLTLDKKKMLKFNEEELLSLIYEVDQIRQESVQDRRFLDAENSKQKLKQLKEVLEKQKKSKFKKTQQTEKSKLEDDFAAEMENFTNHWNEKISNYQNECKQMENELIEHNKAQLEEYRQQLEESIPLKPKDSTKLLDMKHQIEMLVKNQEYKDAHYLQQRAFEIEKEEYEKYLSERDKKVANLLDQKVTFHQNEYNSLRKRILNGLDELEIQRKKEYERLYLKYNNLKKNIENQQTMQSIMLEKSMAHSNLHNSLKNYYVSNEDKQINSYQYSIQFFLQNISNFQLSQLPVKTSSKNILFKQNSIITIYCNHQQNHLTLKYLHIKQSQ